VKSNTSEYTQPFFSRQERPIFVLLAVSHTETFDTVILYRRVRNYLGGKQEISCSMYKYLHVRFKRRMLISGERFSTYQGCSNRACKVGLIDEVF
jgi:hypothetical protein